MTKTTVIDIGESVLCDICNVDYSDSDKRGGFIFTSKGYCPDCAGDGMKSIKKYGEEKYIKAICPKDMSFKDFILGYRGGDNTIKITSF